MLTYFSLHASLGSCVLVCVCVSLCGCFRASPALAATSAAVMLSSFWRTRNVSAGPTTLAAPSQRDAHTWIWSETVKRATLTRWQKDEGGVTWCWWSCWLSGVSCQPVAPTVSHRRTNSEDYRRQRQITILLVGTAWWAWQHRRCASYLSWTGGQNNDLVECWPLVGDDVPILLLGLCALNQRRPLLLQALPSLSRNSLCRLGVRRGEGLGRSCGWDWSGGVGRRCIMGTRTWSGFLGLTGDTVCF